ncbi:hypothetical protein [Aquimarina macrocephali]|uniref:hypothetical protein n=1 Tax=Aquimarina macrocephali TaxID=666563 RepID=UPI0004649D4A|nr:hypothetical protein [Aquimarina macrocephali]
MAIKKKLGCFSFPAIILISLVGSSVVQGFFPISLFWAFALLLLLLSWLLGKLDSHQKSFQWRYMLYSTFVLASLLGLRHVLDAIPVSIENQKSDVSEYIYREKTLEEGDSIMLLRQDRQWTDNYGNTFKGKFSIREKDYFSSKKEYLNTVQKHKKGSWGKLYQYLVTSDTPRLDLILEELTTIKNTNKLNQFEFAEMVVTFIQDIPYSFVFENDCESPEKYEESIRVILEECSDCCIGNIPFGIQNPVGFMGNLKGDCDTRTVIIYAILSHFGYDVAILNSDYYKHSVLGLHIPAKGIYKVQNGKRYYIWETTNKHFTIGTLPKNFDNINHWHIVLTNT